MRAKNGPGFQARPSLFADDYLAEGDRDYYGDDVALDLALDRYVEATERHRRTEPDLDPDVDIIDERPEVDEQRTDDVALEVFAHRRALLTGRGPLAWREATR